MKQGETPVRDEIYDMLILNGYHVGKTTGNIWEEVGRPDIMGFDPCGCHVGVEVKTKKRKLTDEQMDYLQVLDKTEKGFACCCTSVDYVFIKMTCPHCGKSAYGDYCFYCNKKKVVECKTK